MIERIVPVVKGVQATKYDAWLEKFVQPGHSLFFTEGELSKQTASNAAKRLTLLDSKKGGRKFHSYYDVLEQMVVIRVRPAGEVPDKGDDDEKDDKIENAPKQETLQEIMDRLNTSDDEGEHVTEQGEQTLQFD